MQGVPLGKGDFLGQARTLPAGAAAPKAG